MKNRTKFTVMGLLNKLQRLSHKGGKKLQTDLIHHLMFTLAPKWYQSHFTKNHKNT